MLVLTRKQGEAVVIGSDIRMKVLRVRSGGIRLGIEAPSDVVILREELNEWRSDSRRGKPAHRRKASNDRNSRYQAKRAVA
jgi:carbon storage regulator